MNGPCSEKDCLKGERCVVLTTSKSAVCLKKGMYVCMYVGMYQKVKIYLVIYICLFHLNVFFRMSTQIIFIRQFFKNLLSTCGGKNFILG